MSCVDKVNWPPWRVKKLMFWGLALCQSNDEALTKGQCFRHQLLNSLRLPIYIINLFDNTRFTRKLLCLWHDHNDGCLLHGFDSCLDETVSVDHAVLVRFFFNNGMVCWWNTSLTCSYLCCTGIKESDTGLAPPALWDLAADKQTLQGEQPLQVHYIIWKL